MNKTKFIKDYLINLKERTRREKTGIKTGFDIVINNLMIAKGYIDVRKPFFEAAKGETPKTKSEAELGVDFAFYDSTNKKLFVFVLKDEALNNANWNKHNFDSDIRMASTVNIDRMGYLGEISSIEIILAYNKDEDETGIQLFENLKQNLGTVVRDNLPISYTRWNLTKITQEVEEHLFTSELLPPHLAGIFDYICSQFKDFDYGTEEWNTQLIPLWQRFLKQILTDKIEEKDLRLIALILIILQTCKNEKGNAQIGWIDLIEWAILELWNIYPTLKTTNLKQSVIQIWSVLYIGELERYFDEQYKNLSTEQCFQNIISQHFPLTPLVNANSAFWHIGRLGILFTGPQEFLSRLEDKTALQQWVGKWSDLMVNMIENNPACYRPLIDLHHIELFLIWLCLWQTGNQEELTLWLTCLKNRLLARRINPNTLPFVEGGNRLELICEYIVLKEKPEEFVDTTSYLLLMLLEMCFSIQNSDEKNKLINEYIEKLVCGNIYSNPKDNEDVFKINLQSWIPEKDWSENVINKQIKDGIYVPFTTREKDYVKEIEDFVKMTRKSDNFSVNLAIPSSIYILACIKNKSPLPPEFWRAQIWRPEEAKSSFTPKVT